MPLSKFAQQLNVMKKITQAAGSILLITQVAMSYVIYSNPELKPIGGLWFFLALTGFVVFQYFYYLVNQAQPNPSRIKNTTAVIGVLWLSTIVLLLFEPVEFLPSSQIAVMIGFMVLHHRLWLQSFEQLTVPFKIHNLISATLFALSIFVLVNTETTPQLSAFVRFKVSIHSLLVLLFIGFDRYVIDLLQNEKHIQLKLAHEKNIELKSTLLNEIDKHIHKPLILLKISLESLRLNSYGEPREIASNGIKQLFQIDKYLNSITKVNQIKEEEKITTNRVIQEISVAYKEWISVQCDGIPEENFMNQNEFFGLRTLLDFAINNKSKYCSLDVLFVNGKPMFEVTFDGPGLTDSILKLSLKEGVGGFNEAYDLKLAFRLLQKEGYAIMISNQLLQGSRFLIICEDVDISKYELPGKTNTIVQ